MSLGFVLPPRAKASDVPGWTWETLHPQFTGADPATFPRTWPGFLEAGVRYGLVENSPAGLATWDWWTRDPERSYGQPFEEEWRRFLDWAGRRYTPGGGLDDEDNVLPDDFPTR